MEKDDEFKGIGNHISFNDYGYDPRIVRRFSPDPVWQHDISDYSVFNNNPNFYLDPDGESPISIFAKMVAKQGIKLAAKQFIKNQIKSRLTKYMSKKWAKQLVKDADDLIETLESEWWEYVIEVIPLAGDAYGAYSLTKKGKQLWDKLDALEKRVEAITKRTEALQRMIKSGFKKVGDKFDPKKYRDNLRIKTGKLGDGFDAHHTLPKSKEFANFFEKAGLDVNDPDNLIWREAKSHRGTNSSEHLKLWREFMKRNPKADKEQILKQRDVIERKVWGNVSGDTPEL